jgi:hypothetical protein
MQWGMAGLTQVQADWRPLIKAYFGNDDLRAFGAATMHSMVLAGYPVENLVNAEEVESYLKEKGMVEVGENEIQLELIIPTPSLMALEVDVEHDVSAELQSLTTRTAARSGGSRRSQKRIVSLSAPDLIEQFTNLSISTGNGISYPKDRLNMAVVASVVRTGN